MQTLSQKRAQFALDKVFHYRDEKKLKNFSAGAPAVILQNGLGHALAFWYAKGKNEHKALTSIIEQWLKKQSLKLSDARESKEFLEKIVNLNQREYHTVQQETIFLLEWVKRFAQAFIEEDDEGKNQPQ